ncbi:MULTISPECIES: septum site-determining protein MinC [Clostridium]|uniref:septum site-determining protein MinC n=1 Tax=Clostridium TaxID=1485 RepID=UPI00030ADD54|nr:MULTISPECIES: septum site-determining protein MinC [Clostridium]
MQDNKIVFKGNKEGLNIVIDANRFKNTEEVINALVKKLSPAKRFYKGATLNITTDMKQIDERDQIRIKEILFDDFGIKDCIYQDSGERINKFFNGVSEGRTKFVRKTIRSGQRYEYSGNLVVIGDINPGAEVYAAGNIIVLGSIKGAIHAGSNGNEKAFVAGFSLQPQILQIANIITRSPEDNTRPQYPELARIKNGNIIVEPYLVNKYI